MKALLISDPHFHSQKRFFRSVFSLIGDIYKEILGNTNEGVVGRNDWEYFSVNTHA